jgi:hypothetical protein
VGGDDSVSGSKLAWFSVIPVSISNRKVLRAYNQRMELAMLFKS